MFNRRFYCAKSESGLFSQCFETFLENPNFSSFLIQTSLTYLLCCLLRSSNLGPQVRSDLSSALDLSDPLISSVNNSHPYPSSLFCPACLHHLSASGFGCHSRSLFCMRNQSLQIFAPIEHLFYVLRAFHIQFDAFSLT